MARREKERLDGLRLEALAEFRHQLRRFLAFSEDAAAREGLPAQQHQMLLQVAGAPEGAEVTVAYAAERLGVRHHSAVELSKRCEDAGLLERLQDVADGRRVLLRLTSGGERTLRALSEDHARELQEMAPRLVEALTRIGELHAKSAEARSVQPRSAEPRSAEPRSRGNGVSLGGTPSGRLDPEEAKGRMR